MRIDPTLKQFILQGKVILFFGAGASLGAKSADGKEMPTTSELRDQIAINFLDRSWTNSPLSEVAEIAISQADIVTVQSFLRDIFLDFEPEEYQKKVPKFKWSGIYTTNYDLLIEKAYQSYDDPNKQELVPIYRTTDRIESKIKDKSQQVAYTKLHGCINKVAEEDLPLILTPEQYVSHKEGREKLFDRLEDQAITHPILFVGHSLNDSDVREVLQKVGSLTGSRPRCWALMYDFKDQHRTLWESKRISLIKGSFEDFINSLDEQTSEIEKNYVRTSSSHPVEAKFVSNDYSLTKETLRVMDNPLIFISQTMSLDEHCSPNLFYHGYSNGWSPIIEELDVRRRLADEIVSDVILAEESEKINKVELFNVSGPAGCGKSVVLKRIAYDSAIDYDRTCLFWDSNENLDINAIFEIAEKVDERIYLFLDKASIHVHDLLSLLAKFKRTKLPITCFVAERTNVWNTECSALSRFLTNTFELRNLSLNEINDLISKLEKHECLGALKELSKEEQINAFTNRMGRQLLVTLHEATMAKSFVEIIQDEYDNIAERKAQLIYRTVCIMNQFGIPVRAGIIHRIHHVDFEAFKESFFEPLENVLHVVGAHTQDMSYEARHPSIAEMVFSHALSTDDERLNSYLSLLQSLDIGYSSDRTAFRELIKYRHLNSVFGNPQDIEKIYKLSFSVCGHDDFYYQQFAIFYMRSSFQRLSLAEKYLNLAREYGHHNHSISHTWAELELIKAGKTKGLERDRLFNKASRLALEASRSASDSSYGHSTLCKIAIQRLEDALSTDDDELISDATDKAKQASNNALKSNPDNDILLELDARIAVLLNDNDRATKALERAFSVNNGNSHLASALGDIYLSKGGVNKALSVYGKVLEANHSDKTAHGKLAHIYSTLLTAGNNEKAEYHWRRSFTDGDGNIVNHVWYSRQLYLNNKFEEFKTFINKIKSYRMPPLTRNTIRGFVCEDGKRSFFTGIVVKQEASYMLLESTGFKGFHFLHVSNCSEDEWEKHTVGSQVCYNLGFTVSGAAAVLP